MAIPILCIVAIFIQGMFAEGAVKLGASLKPSASGQQQSWQSPGKYFSLGFHPSGNRGLYVVGISFANINYSTLVWTAGFNGGIEVGEGGSFTLQSDGKLVLSNGTQILWQTNTSSLGVASADMKDDGNFVLQNSSSGTVWDSFSNPTDSLVVNQNLTVNQSLRSGLYTFAMQPSGNFTLTWNNNVTYLNEGTPLATTATLTGQGIFKLSNSSNDSIWWARTIDYSDSSTAVRRMKLESNGNLRSYRWDTNSRTWQRVWSAVEDQCKVYGWCGNFGVCLYNNTDPYCECPSADFDRIDPSDATKGCRRQQDIAQCSNNQSMVRLNNTEFFSYPPDLESNSEIYTLAFQDCWQNCLKNPSCTAATIMADGAGTCRMKTNEFTSAYQTASISSTSYVKVCGSGRPLTPPPPPVRIVNRFTAIEISLAVIAPVIGLMTIHICLWWVCCRKNPRFRFGDSPALYAPLDYASGSPVQFSYKDLLHCTKNFTEKVGSGGFGTVYKGELSNEAMVAVKRLEGIEQGEKQFRMEVATISSTHHLNLVRLIGFCSEGRHRLLVYEFMKNSSLDTFLFTSSEQAKTLDWDTRFNIAFGTAKGIAYLHEECRDCIVHCDIKPENILLDENFNAKVSDFGLSKLIHARAHRNLSLSSVRGTRGYLAPEWLANLPITSNSDVYSYGMLLLEIVSGRRNFDILPSERKRFSIWAFEEYEKGNITNIIDEKLGTNLNIDQIQRVIEISFWCIQEHPSQRPSMGKVVQMLEGVLPMEKPPAPRHLESLQNDSSSNTSQTATSMLTSSDPQTPTFSVNGVLPANSSIYLAETLSGGR
ncbi:G-type lectin S-receptor-like serine/threonine-protein kinase At1g34300 [Cryptomeria japonica]|uniref:G-type lectin S-receptor-like serine/threonine-protein kinase At1g34300 n=1 Tax=Cryptomeria japonica TaxID=3369 RepID=UPI0027DA2464|nr:G-type lectin S-receptor-like serine/threonine-protein kinase At1g34300 [Cryptomeria japonica]